MSYREMPKPKLNPARTGHTYPSVYVSDSANVQLGDINYNLQIQDSSLTNEGTTANFDVDEVQSVANLAWKLYKSCRSAPDSFCSISQDLTSLRAVLEECEEVFPNITQSQKRAQRLQTITSGCDDTLQDLDAIVQNFQELGLQQKRTWERLKWREHDWRD